MALIEFFEVPPGDDDAFLAAWRSESAPEATLFRAIRDDVPVRFVGLAPHDGSYEVVHDEGAVDGSGGVVLIHPFDAADDRFLPDWRALQDVLAARQGHIGTRLYRIADHQPAFVHLARWSSPLMVFRAVQDPAFAAAASRIGFPGQPALYQVV